MCPDKRLPRLLKRSRNDNLIIFSFVYLQSVLIDAEMYLLMDWWVEYSAIMTS